MGETFHRQVDASRGDPAESLLQISPNTRINSDTDLRHRVRLDGDDRFSLMRFEAAGEFEGANAPDGSVTVAFTRSGALDWEVGDQRGTGTVPFVLSLDDPIFSRMRAIDQFALFLKQEPLTTFARALYGEDRFRLDFDSPLPVDQQHGRHVGALLVLAQQTAETELFTEPILRASLYRSLAITLLESYRLTGDRRARTITAEGRLRRYRLAQQFIDDHASLPITVEDIAQTVGASTRELEEIFRGHSPAGRGVSATLRRARLAAAHNDLVVADPTLGDTVRGIAHRWGYSSASTFAKHYRDAYGINPKWVLDR